MARAPRKSPLAGRRIVLGVTGSIAAYKACELVRLFVKAGAVEDFNASTEAEMRLYTPTITDFMIVVKRSQVGQKIPFHAVLVSEWTENLQSLAFMVTEDDGGTFTTWKCTAKVTIKSRSYGFDIEIPFRTRDDIVWRGQLTRSYFEKNNDVEGRFGDVWLTFGII